MPLRVSCEHYVPPPVPRVGAPSSLSDKEAAADFNTYLSGAAGTVELLAQYGLDTTPTQDDLNAAAAIAAAYAEDPVKVVQTVNTPQKIAKLPPPALRETYRILSVFGHNIVENSLQIRHLVTNKLIDLSESPDPKVQLKALELLGKISDVGLFAERSEVTVTHQTPEDLRARLKEKLTQMVDITDAVEVGGTLTGRDNPGQDTQPTNEPFYNEVETFITPPKKTLRDILAEDEDDED
jgi:hypothetical protein